MICKRSLPRLVAEWRSLHAAVETFELELPVLGPFKVALEEALEDVVASRARQISLERQRRQATKDLHDNVDATRELVMRLQNLVKGTLGRMDSRLVAFGIKSFRFRSRKPSELAQQDVSPGVH
ncbi:MAG TPA: hypothetical protein VGX68_13800 [Thermoanaerobaculia bacterium]|jgi:hypothetical protein|nr:hypothetical protein [Thermoanaerobaculia bacterium]